MANHPNRSKTAGAPPGNPTPDEIRAAREALELTQAAAARLIYCSVRTWQDWESGARRMHPAFWSLFLCTTSPHLRAQLLDRAEA